jgi:histidinol-phosphate aminotransferase
VTPRDAVLRMAPYSPPSGGRAEKLRLDFNENTVGCSPKVIEALRAYLTADALTIYPEYAAATKDLAQFFDVSRDQFTITNGTDEAIQVLVNTFVPDGADVVTMHPSYAMYRFYAELAGAKVRAVDYPRPDLHFPTQGLLQAIRPETKAILLANPNNPTGTPIAQADIERILRAAPQAAVLIDEAYFEFHGETVLRWIDSYSNLFVSRTFSKTYGMAAMRCGCLFSSASNVSWLKKAQSPYSVNMLAAVAARAAVTDREYVAAYVRGALEARTLIQQGLDRLSIRHFPTAANFVLFQAGKRAVEIRDALRDRGVLVRDRSYEIEGCVRVTCGTPEQARLFLTELETLWRS